MASKNGPYPGILHKFASKPTAFEHLRPNSSSSARNLLIWIGGLSDVLLHVHYPTTVADHLPSDWTLAQVNLSSAGPGFGTLSLAHDCAELSEAVTYFRGRKSGKIVLFGHSTGSQDVIEYLAGPGRDDRAVVDGAIIQAPVSDREVLEMMMTPDAYQRTISVARQMIDAGDANGIVPMTKEENVFDAPISAYRWLSLASPDHDGDDDKFSSDFDDEKLMQTFGRLPAHSPLLILYSGEDESVPPGVNKENLVNKWVEIVKRGSGKVDEEYSGIVPGASHNLNGSSEEAVMDLVRRVNGFIGGL